MIYYNIMICYKTLSSQMQKRPWYMYASIFIWSAREVGLILPAPSQWYSSLQQYGINHSFIVTMQQKTPDGKRIIFKSLSAFPSAKISFQSYCTLLPALLTLLVSNGTKHLYVLFLFKLNIYRAWMPFPL